MVSEKACFLELATVSHHHLLPIGADLRCSRPWGLALSPFLQGLNFVPFSFAFAFALLCRAVLGHVVHLAAPVAYRPTIDGDLVALFLVPNQLAALPSPSSV